MFVFGDTIRDTDVVSPFMVRNSVLVANGGCLRAMRAGDDGAVIPDEGDTGYWPMSLRARAVPGGTRVEVITAAVRDLGVVLDVVVADVALRRAGDGEKARDLLVGEARQIKAD